MSTQQSVAAPATHWVRVALALAVAGLLALVSGGILMVVGGSASADPPGSNGEFVVTAQVETFTPAMDPHLPCDIRVWFYGYDEGETVESVVFTPQPPTAGTDGQGVAYRVTATGPTSGTMGPQDPENHRLNLFLDYSLAWTGAAHPEQGYNVKLEVVTGDTENKSKVFWVQCTAPVPTPTETPTTPPTETPTTPTTPPAETPAATPTDTVEPDEGTEASAGGGEESAGPSETSESDDSSGPVGTGEPDETQGAAPAGGGDDLEGDVPRAVDAGLGGWSTTEVWGAGLLGGGLALLLASGGVLMGARRLETV